VLRVRTVAAHLYRALHRRHRSLRACTRRPRWHGRAPPCRGGPQLLGRDLHRSLHDTAASTGVNGSSRAAQQISLLNTLPTPQQALIEQRS
jgi:hypothetical protein